MECEVQEVVASLDSKDPAFRDQVQRMREFKERMKEAGVEIKTNRFQISLTEGMSPPPRRALTRSV